MICDGVTDLVNVLINIYNEKDETKKVYLIVFLEGVEPMFLCILMLRMFTVGDDLGSRQGGQSKKKCDNVTL